MLLSAVRVGDTFHVENAISVRDTHCQHIDMESLLQFEQKYPRRFSAMLNEGRKNRSNDFF